MRCLVRDTRKRAVRAWSPNLLPILAGATAEEWLQQRGVDYDIASLKPAIQEAYVAMQAMYPDARHIQDWEAGERLAEVIPHELQEAMGDRIAVLGDPDQVVSRMKEIEALGVDHIYMYPCETFNLPEPELRAFREVIGPAFGIST